MMRLTSLTNDQISILTKNSIVYCIPILFKTRSMILYDRLKFREIQVGYLNKRRCNNIILHNILIKEFSFTE